jgi:hypothetical protein
MRQYVEKCQRCRPKPTVIATSAPDVVVRLLEDCGIPAGFTSEAHADFTLCPRCSSDEVTYRSHGIPQVTPSMWPVDAYHPFTVRLWGIMDEEVARVIAERAA